MFSNERERIHRISRAKYTKYCSFAIPANACALALSVAESGSEILEAFALHSFLWSGPRQMRYFEKILNLLLHYANWTSWYLSLPPRSNAWLKLTHLCTTEPRMLLVCNNTNECFLSFIAAESKPIPKERN